MFRAAKLTRAVLALALAACNSTAPVSPAADIGPPVPASAFDVPATRAMRHTAPYRDFGPHDAAVRAFIAQRSASYVQEHVHKEVELDPKHVPSFGVYANQTMYEDLRMPANPEPKKVSAVLFASTRALPQNTFERRATVYPNTRSKRFSDGTGKRGIWCCTTA